MKLEQGRALVKWTLRISSDISTPILQSFRKMNDCFGPLLTTQAAHAASGGNLLSRQLGPIDSRHNLSHALARLLRRGQRVSRQTRIGTFIQVTRGKKTNLLIQSPHQGISQFFWLRPEPVTKNSPLQELPQVRSLLNPHLHPTRNL